jgi:hypothetical protein
MPEYNGNVGTDRVLLSSIHFMFWNLSSISHAWPDLFLQAAIAAAFSKLTVQDLRKLIPPEFYPSWVSFTQKQKLSFCLCFYVVQYCWY